MASVPTSWPNTAQNVRTLGGSLANCANMGPLIVGDTDEVGGREYK
jgi:hypothetical protein